MRSKISRVMNLIVLRLNVLLLVAILVLVVCVPMIQSTVWNWVIPNIFKGAPSIDYWGALGLSLVLAMFSISSAAGSRRK